MKFNLGQIVSMPGALEACLPEHLAKCLARHACGDWSDMCTEDAASNNKAIAEGLRILSAYPIDPANSRAGLDNTLWIITEADRSVTTLLLPREWRSRRNGRWRILDTGCAEGEDEQE